MDFPYVYYWNRQDRKGQFCRVTARGKMNSCCCEFPDGYKMITSRNAIRRRKMNDRHIYAYTTPGAARPGFLSIFERDGEIIVSMRAIGGTAIHLTLPPDELRKLCGHLTAEYRKPSGKALLGS